MKIIDILNRGKKTMSFEVFPPKTDDKFDSVQRATEEIAAMGPAYMSVTYGAGGNGSRYTLPIAANIEKRFGVPVIHHLTCVGSTEENIRERVGYMKSEGISNILALRGDIPEGDTPDSWRYHHADELAAGLREMGDFCIGGACYPEGHPEAASLEEDVLNLKKKVDSGCEFLTTQLFLDNGIFYSFLEKIAAVGIKAPVTAGIMAITSVRQFARISSLSGSVIPDEMKRIGEKYAEDPEGMKAAGIEYAEKQIRDLYENGVMAVHLYTMNNASLARRIITDFSDTIGE